jgi:beta-glucosidase
VEVSVIRRTNSIAIGAAILFLALVPCGLLAAGQAKKQKPYPFQDPSLPIAERVNDLVSRMTLEEKVLQMQHTAPAIPRLGIPSYDWWNEALHGVARSGYATVFPQAIGMAATWDKDLIYREGRVISTEARAKYNQAQREGNHSIYYGLTFWSPNINIFRDPRWGRGQETYGEDPFLTGKLGVQFVEGLQGDNPKYLETVATPKHYAVHSGPEPLRHGFNVNVSPRDLEATYLPAFRDTIVDAHADSTMCAYNAIDGVPACASTMLLQKTLRDDWHFDGYVTSDCGAVEDITTGHHYTPDNEHGSAVAVKAGTDTTCGNEYVALPQAVKAGLIKESEIARIHGAAEKSGRHAAAQLKHQDDCGHRPECGIASGARGQLQRCALAPGLSAGRNAQAIRGQSEGALRAGLALCARDGCSHASNVVSSGGGSRGIRLEGRIFR